MRIFEKLKWIFEPFLSALGKGSGIQRELDDLLVKFMTSGVPISDDDLIRAHKLRLEITKEGEQRIRSIQTLLSLGCPDAGVVAFRELVTLAKAWPERDVGILFPAMAELLWRRCGDFRALWIAKVV